MAKYSNVVEYNIITDVDTSGITKLQNELTKLKQSLKFDGGAFNRLGLNSNEIDKSIKKINQLQTALTAAFNPKIGTLDLSKLNASLQKEHVNLQMIVKDWEQMGYRGQAAISSLSNALLSMNKGAVTVNTTLSKIANTFSNTVRWGITASIFQEMMSSVQGAVSYMKDLDESLTNIQMVTNSSKEDMRELAQYANNAAQALGSTTTDYTNAVKVFVQEGFSESESKQYANLSTKLANVSEQNTATTSDQITAYRNAFQLDYQQTVEAMDKVANVANNTASNVNELMTASQRAASVAQAVGSSQDSFLAAIATIESVTRQSAEEIGNGLKTIYQRFADIKVSGKTDDGVDYGQYAKALQQVGVDVLDVSGQFKGMDQILAELQEVWSSLDDTMKIAVGEKVAGKFQYNRFAALMNNPEYYQKAFAATQNAGGMMDQMNEYYMEGIEGRLNTLQAAGEQVMSTLFDQDTIEPIIEDVTKLVNGLNDIAEAAGGLTGVIQALGAIMLRTFSTQIAGTISNIASSISMVIANSRNANQLSTSVELLGLNRLNQSTLENSKATKLVTGVTPNYDSLSEKTREKIRDLSQQIVELEDERVRLLKEQEKTITEIQARALGEKEIIDAKLKSQGTLYVERKKELELQLQTGKITKEQYNNKIDEIETIRISLQELAKKRKLYNQIEKAVADYNKKIAEGKTLEEQDVQELLKMKEAARGLGIDVEKLDKILQDMGINIQNLNLADKVVGDTTKMATFEAKVNNIVKTLSSITSVAFGFSMIGDMFETLSDETATFEDKLNAVIMNGTMGLTMLLPGLTHMVKGIRELTAAYILENVALVARNEEEAKSIALKMANTEWTLKAIAAKTIEIAKTIAGTVAEAASNVVKVIRNILDGNWITIAAAAAVAIGAITIAVVAATKAWIDNYGELAQANKKYEEQNKILTETKQNYQAVAEDLETLKSSMEKIGDKQKNLSDLTEGTNEWREAVRNLNQEILTLLQTYPQLAQYVHNDNGVLSVEEEGLNKLYDEQIEKAQHLNDINSIQQINTLQAKNDQLIAAYASKNNLSTNEVRAGLTKSIGKNEGDEGYGIANRSDLTASFSELAATIQSNQIAIETLNGTIGNLDKDYVNYAGETTATNTAAMEAVQQRWGTQLLDEYGNSLGYQVDLSAQANKAELLTAISEAIGQDVVSGQDTSIFDDTLKVITKDGEEIEHSTQAWLQILANSEQALQAEQELITKNKEIYEALGVEWDSKSNKPKGELSADNQAALQGYLDDASFREEIKSRLGIESIEDFAHAIEKGTINVNGLADALKQLQNSTVDLTTNINGNKFTNRIDISSDKDAMKKLLDDSGMSEGAFNRMSREAYEDENGYYQQEKRYLEELISVKEKDTHITEEEAKEIENLKSKVEGLDEAAKDSTAAILRMSNGVVKLRNNIDNISEILSNENLKGTTEWYEALTDLDKGLSEVLNIDAGTLSDSFIESGDALDYARRMAEGDMTAIDDLRRAASEDIIQNLAIQVDPDQDADIIRQELMDQLNQLQADIDNEVITIGTDLDTNPFIQKLNEMLAEGQISAEQASNILSSIGMDAEIQYAEGKGSVDAIEYRPTFSGQAIDVETPIGKFSLPGLKMSPVMTKIPTETKIPYLQGTHYTGKGVNTANVAARNPSYTGGYSKNPKKSGGGGNKGKSGGSGKDTKPKDKDKTEWDYLTDITNDLDRAAAVMEKLSKLEDRLYGSSRVSQIKKLQKEYKNYIKLLEQEVKLAENHAQLLRNNAYDENGNLTINGYGYRAGVGSLQFDAQNNLENGKEIEARLVDRVNAAIDDYNAHRNADDASYYEERVSLAQKDHEGFLKALSEYESTLGKIEDGQSQIQDYKEKIQDATDEIVDAIQDSIEDVLEAIDNQRDFNKMYRDWMQGGNSYSHFNNERQYYIEGLEGLLSSRQNNQSSIFETQLSNLQGRINDVENIFDGDSSDADDEKLSEQAAFENLQEATNNIMDSLNQVIDYYDSLLETIEGASDKMDELIDGRLDEFDKLSDYLDTRLDQIKLLFGDNSYEEQAQIYNQKIAVDMEKMVSINTAIEAKQATVDALEKLEASNKELSTEERKELQDARNKVNDLQKEQLNTETKLLQEITERLGAQTNAEMRKLGKELFGGIDVEWLSQQWEMATRFSEKYFDDYNRAFELQKMQLKFQKALSDNQNSSIEAQGKINSLMEEYMSYLREKKNLSEYDIKHAQAQLDMLQKQIALQDAQNNKSQMRLQRNSAGNYDFVYAADEGAVEQAKNELLVAQQDLYNLSKQMYTETYADLIDMFQNAQDMAVQIATDTSLTVEERAARIQTIHDNLNEYFQNSSIELSEISINLYNSFVDAQQSISEENLGALDAVFEQMRKNSLSTGQSMIDNIGGIKETAQTDMDEIETVFKDSFGRIKTDVEGNAQGMQSSITSMIAGIESGIIGEDGSLNKIRVGTNTEFGGIQSDVSGVLESIDKRFGLSETHSIGSIEKIQESINTSCEAITGSALGALEKVDGGFQDNTKKVSGYLGQFKTDVDEALKSAGDNYKTFTKDSVDYSNEHLGQLKDTTQTWRQDLDSLNSMIRISAGEIKTWKKQIDLAIDSSGKLISKANTLQEKIGMDAAMASIATGSFSDFEDAAYRVGSAISTMSHDIESAYYSIRDAADTATDAYNNMASAASDAADNAIWAQDEASNAQDSFGDLVDAARDAMESVARSIDNILSNLWSSINSAGSSSYSGGDWYWDGYTYQYYGYDTGGYTGSWSDKGIDDKNGKLAILHQKELVLNADDTKNMLSTVELVHDIMSNIDKIPSLKKMVNQQNFGDTVKQRVEINATFPGVTEAIEIKQALEHLADNAYQVANRYKY